jgi:hypothetical protein
VIARLAPLAIVALAFALAIAACGGSGEHKATGVIIDVQASSLTELASFTLRENDGRTLIFRVAPEAAADPVEGFFPGHMRTHAVAAEQVTVTYREEPGDLLALRLAHAPPLP